MKISDIKGERTLDIMADALELADSLSDNEAFQAMKEELGNAEDKKAAVLHSLPSLLRDKEVKRGVTKLLASASGVTYKEYANNGPMLKDIIELLTTDTEVLGFLSSQQTDRETAGEH
jgi:hypothetical protein